MIRTGTAKQSEELTVSEKWAEVLNRPAIREIPSDIQILVDGVVHIGYDHARSVDAYTKDLLEEMSHWSAGQHLSKVDRDDNYTKAIIQYYTLWDYSLWVPALDQKKRKMELNTTDFLIKYIYDEDWTDSFPVTLARRESELGNMRRMIPFSYVFYGTLFLSLSLIFGITFYYGLHGAGFIVGPWTHLMLFVGAVGLTATAVAAGIEWVKLRSGQEKQEN